VAKDRQRAKQRQAERRARRLAAEREAPAEPRADETEPRVDEGPSQDRVYEVPGVTPGLSVGAPPENEGRSDAVLDGERGLLDSEIGDRARPAEPDASTKTPQTEDEAIREIEDWEVDADDHLTDEEIEEELEAERELSGEGEGGYAVTGRRGRDQAERHKHRPRVIQFLIAVWAELQRVQWPNRQALITLTGVVLGFVLIAGGYLGLLDAIFSELIKAIL
jgi:preprotein translocase SecE subunit